MTTATRCPACDTTFRISREQLAMKRGQVRCGQCLHVFDAYAHLVAPELPAEPPQPVAPPPAIVDYRATMTAIAVPSDAPARADTPELPPAAPLPAAPSPSPSPPPLPPAPAPMSVTPTPASTPTPARAAPLIEPLPPSDAPARRGGALWATGCVLLALALGAQAAYAYRDRLAAEYPPLRPWLEKACTKLACTVNLPQQLRAVSIEASDMQVFDPARPAFVTLTATLRNHEATAIAYPALDVVLTNIKDHTLARRVFLPPEYLDAEHPVRAGFPPSAELTVRLTLDTQDLGASGFRLDLLPAPQPE